MKKIICTILSAILISNPVQKSFAGPNDRIFTLEDEKFNFFPSSASSVITTSYFAIEILSKYKEIYRALLVPSYNILKYVYYKLTDEFVSDPMVLEQRLKSAFSEIKGQESAKELLYGQLFKIFDDIKGVSLNNNGHIIYLSGPSGVGKTMMAERIAKIFLGDRVSQQCISVSSSNINPSNKTVSVCAQLFGHNKFSGYNEVANSPIKEFLKVHNIGVIIINEYDKFFTKETDENIRNILDNNKIYTTYPDFFDCSKIIFIITSNEKHDCLSTKKESKSNEIDNDTVKDSSNQELTPEKITQEIRNTVVTIMDQMNNTFGYEHADLDGTTVTIHDPSLLKRLNPVEFESLNSDALQNISEDFIERKIAHYQKIYGIKLLCDDSCISQIKEYCENSSKEARAINDINSAFSYEISQKIASYLNNQTPISGKTFKLSYSSENKEFSIEELQNTSEIINQSENNLENNLENFEESKSTCGSFLKIIIPTIVLTASLLFLKK